MGAGAQRNFAETQQSGNPKVWTRDQRWRTGEAQMRVISEGGELEPANDDRKHCKKNSSVLSSNVVTKGNSIGWFVYSQFSIWFVET